MPSRSPPSRSRYETWQWREAGQRPEDLAKEELSCLRSLGAMLDVVEECRLVGLHGCAQALVGGLNDT